METDEIEKYNNLDTEALMEMLGAELHKSRMGLLHAKDFRVAGERAYYTYKEKLNSSICGNHSIRRLIESPEVFERAQIISAIADCISGYLTGVTLFVVSTMIAREGLSAYCQKPKS